MSENETPQTPDVEVPGQRAHYSLVNAAVTFDAGRGAVTSDIQFMTVSTDTTFPVDRLTQLQNRAAYGIREQVQDGMPKGKQLPKFVVLDVTFKSIIYLGHMTPLEFHGPEPEPENTAQQ